MPEEKPTIKDDKELQIVTFHIGEEEFGIDIFLVRSIIKMLNVTKVPHSPDFVEGVINLRGKVIPLINLRKRFGLKEKPYERQTRIIIVEIENQIGFIVDSVSEVLRISSSNIMPPPSIAVIDVEYINGVYKQHSDSKNKQTGDTEGRLIILLDIAKVLSSYEKSQIRDGFS